MSPRLVELDVDECLRLLKGHAPHLGRVAFDGPLGPVVLPVNYRVHRGSVVFLTDPGSKMLAAATHERISFQVDSVDPTWQEGWSVLIHGTGREVTDADERRAIEDLGLRAWAGSSAHAIEILPTQITGRRIV